jgi:hypothetical protein
LRDEVGGERFGADSAANSPVEADDLEVSLTWKTVSFERVVEEIVEVVLGESAGRAKSRLSFGVDVLPDTVLLIEPVASGDESVCEEWRCGMLQQGDEQEEKEKGKDDEPSA